jgi:hypothetical protein
VFVIVTEPSTMSPIFIAEAERALSDRWVRAKAALSRGGNRVTRFAGARGGKATALLGF